MSFTSHVLRGSSGEATLQILEGKLEATTAQGRPRGMWLDDIKHWTELNTYEAINWRKIDVNGEPVLQHVNLLNQKTTADDDDELIVASAVVGPVFI